MAEVLEIAPQDMTRVNQALSHYPRLQEMIDAEPSVLKLLKLASMQRSGFARWRAYEILKRIGMQYVGWDARNQALRDSPCYETYVQAIDFLLPSEDAEDEESACLTQLQAVQPLRRDVTRLLPEATIPAFLFEEHEEPTLFDEETA